MQFFVIGDWETVLGFRLTGVRGIAAATREETLSALSKALEQRDIGVILMTERLAAGIRDEVEARLYGRGFPLLLEVPGAEGPEPGRLSVEDVVRKAVGMSL